MKNKKALKCINQVSSVLIYSKFVLFLMYFSLQTLFRLFIIKLLYILYYNYYISTYLASLPTDFALESHLHTLYMIFFLFLR